MLKWPNEILQQQDTEAVHKMRVASRRLRAALEAFESSASPQPFKKVNRRAKQLADRLGAVRDTDVMIQGLQAYLQEVSGQEQAAGVQWLIDRLDTYHRQEKQALDTELEALDADTLRQQIESCLSKGGAHNGKSSTTYRT
jgi:CHAD domain-containing protein